LSTVIKRPRITAFNDFGGRTPSDKPPIQSPAERAKERGEPWPPERTAQREPTPVGSVGGGHTGLPSPNGGHPQPTPQPTPNGTPPYGGGQPGGFPPGYRGQGYSEGGNGNEPHSVPPNYGAPPDWRPAIVPRGQDWPPPDKWDDSRTEQVRPVAPPSQSHPDDGSWADDGSWRGPQDGSAGSDGVEGNGSGWTPPASDGKH
jgi:cell division protease FtsH